GKAHRHRDRRRHAELRLERLHELRQLEDADAFDVFDDLILRNSHCCAPSNGRAGLQTRRLRRTSRSALHISHPCDCFFSYCDNTFTRSRGTALSTRTRLVIGACSVPSSRAYSSGLPGMFARSVTAAGPIALPWTTAALMVSVGVALMNVVNVFASATGSVSV